MPTLAQINHMFNGVGKGGFHLSPSLMAKVGRGASTFPLTDGKGGEGGFHLSPSLMAKVGRGLQDLKPCLTLTPGSECRPAAAVSAHTAGPG